MNVGIMFCSLLTHFCCVCVGFSTGMSVSSTTFTPQSSLTSSRYFSQNGTLPSSHHHYQKLKQRKIIVSTVLEEPYVMLKPSGMFMTGNDRFHGYLVDLLNKISNYLGFNHEIRLSRDGKYGELMDGVWDGSIGEVLSEAADIAAGPLVADEQKHHHVDFTEPFLTLRSSALIKRPHHRNRTTDQLNIQVPMVADELLNNMEYIVGVLRNGPAQKSLSTSTNPLYRTAWARATSSWPSGIVDSIQEGIERARREKFAFIVDSPIAEYVAGRKPCDLLATEPFLESIKYALVLRKGDKVLRQSLDRSLRQMRDNSELQALYLKWWRDECKRFHTSSAVKRSNSTLTEKRTPASHHSHRHSTPAPYRFDDTSSCRDTSISYALLPLIYLRVIGSLMDI